MKFLFDRLGICVSALCLVHCLLMPFILIFSPTLLSLAQEHHHQIHWTLAGFAFFSAGVSLAPKIGQPSHKKIILLAFLGVSSILTAITIGHDISEVAETALTCLGSLFLISAHIFNIRTTKV